MVCLQLGETSLHGPPPRVRGNRFLAERGVPRAAPDSSSSRRQYSVLWSQDANSVVPLFVSLQTIRVPSIATDTFGMYYVLFLLHTHYMFRPLRAIFRWIIYTSYFISSCFPTTGPLFVLLVCVMLCHDTA
jgi:hypothetical protein